VLARWLRTNHGSAHPPFPPARLVENDDNRPRAAACLNFIMSLFQTLIRKITGRRSGRILPPTTRQISKASRILLGAGMDIRKGWISTDQQSLDVTSKEAFLRYWKPESRTAFCAEHVWEHLHPEQASAGAANCFAFLKPGGVLRLAVPDGLHPDPSYREWVRPGGNGPGADDHKLLYTHVMMQKLLEDAGFTVQLLEHWDEAGEFHFTDWTDGSGHIRRSRRYDERNKDGTLRYTSLIVDGIKPGN